MRDRFDDDPTDEPERDPALGRMLGRLDDAPGADDARRTAALGDRILMAAGPALARLRAASEAEPAGAAAVVSAPHGPNRIAGWWEWIAGWSPAAVPLSLAAAAIALLAAVRLPTAASSAGTAAPLAGVVVERSVSDQAVLAAVAGPSAWAVDTLMGPATGEWLLAAAMQLQLPADAPAGEAVSQNEDSMTTGYDELDAVRPAGGLPPGEDAGPAGTTDSGGAEPGRGAPR